MTRLVDDPSTFREQLLAGFEQAYSRYVRRVPGASGFVRRDRGGAPAVALVVGGGAGHYPSYAGIVGRGLARGAVTGDVFTSPSAEQVYRVAKAADEGRGVVLAYGNYAGDRLNFAAAAERLRAQGIPARQVWVTDDIASAPPNDRGRRRGIAGTVAVYKAGGAAAERGDDLDEVERLMRATNDATFSFGVAFAGCTLPGAREPLFTVDAGRMELGLGIHGEPGVRSVESVPGVELARILVDAVLAERPAGASRAAVVVNGLGATKYEELFLLYGHVAALLREADVLPVLPEVGELVTSLDMAGCSLSLTWLDAELEELWRAPADAAAFSRSGTEADAPVATAGFAGTTAAVPVPPADEPSRAAAQVLQSLLQQWVLVARERHEDWGRLDAAAGDGDHGTGMLRGLLAASTAADETVRAGGGAGTVLAAAGSAFSDRAGGTSGILWGILLSSLGSVVGDDGPLTGPRVAQAFATATSTLATVGGAQPGDKTLLDALVPFTQTLGDGVAAGDALAAAWERAAALARERAAATADLVARIGRARPLGERSLGTPDPGATSFADLAVAAVSAVRRL